MQYDTTEAKRLADAAGWVPVNQCPEEWKGTATETPHGLDVRAVYLEGYCPDLESPHSDPVAAISMVWWEPGEKNGRGCWYGENSWEMHPTHLRKVRPAPGQPDPLAASLRDAVAEIERLREALREAADAMTCGPDKHGDNPAHYCPNCDNTSFNARANIRALLGGGHGHD